MSGDPAAPRDPEAALALARERAAARPPESEPPAWERVHLAPGGPPGRLDLVRWATVEPDVEQVRSTRRLGRPVTAIKRVLLRLLGQYHADLLGQQVRYNQHLALLASSLQERVDALESRVAALDDGAPHSRASAAGGPGPAGGDERERDADPAAADDVRSADRLGATGPDHGSAAS